MDIKVDKVNSFDAHMHFCIDGKEITLMELDKVKSSYINRGIFHIRDMGHRTGIGLKAKELFKNEINIETAGYALYKSGGYGSFLGIPVSGKSEIKEKIGFLYKEGADFIKIINSGIVTTKPANPISNGGFNIEELKIIVFEAKRLGLNVFCHANGDDNIKNAIIAGVSSIEHGFFIKRETIYMLKEKSVVWTPTVNALKSIIKFVTAQEGKYIYNIIDEHLEMLTFANSIGVKINIGSDSGSKGIHHGEAYFEERELLMGIGAIV